MSRIAAPTQPIHDPVNGSTAASVPETPGLNSRITAAYIRLTREESIRKGLSAPAQRADIREYVNNSDLPSMTVYEEPQAVGGDVPFAKREAGRRLIADIEAGRVAHVVVRDMDRLSRDVRLWLDLMDLCLDQGVQIHTVSGPLEIEAPTDEFASIVRAAAAQLERKQVGDRVRRVKRELARRGRHLGGPPPYGYTSQARRRAELVASGLSEDEARVQAEVDHTQRGHLYVDQAEAKVVRLIFDWYVTRRWGCRRIVNELNRLSHRRRPEVPGSPGRLWHPDKVRRVVSDPVLAGFIAHDPVRFETRGRRRTPRAEQTLHEGKHEAIVPEELWRRAQEIRKANTCLHLNKGDVSYANRRYALSSVLRCSCGALMKAGSTRADKHYGYYVCSNRKYFGPDAVGGCNFPRVNTAKVHEAFWTKLSELINTPGLVDRVYEAAKAMLQAKADEVEPDHDTELKRLESDLAVWYRRHDAAKLDIEKEAAWRRIVELTAEQKQVKARAQQQPSKPDPPVITRGRVAEYLESLGRLIRESGDAGKALVQSLVEHHGLTVTLKDANTLAISVALRPPDADGKASSDHLVELAGDARMPKDKITAWLEEHQSKCRCKICGKVLKVQRRHYWRGLPKHHPSCWAGSLTSRRVEAIAKEFYTGQQVAEKLGIGRSTVNRWIRKGKLPGPVRRTSAMLLFDREPINEIAERMGHNGS